MLIGPMLQRLRASRGLAEALRTALEDVVALHGAERGNIQLIDPEGKLVIVQHLGLSSEFLRVFERVDPQDGSVCARAASRCQTVFVPDVESDADFAPYRLLARAVPFRSVLSSPLVGASEACVGIISVHFANLFQPSKLELQSLEAYCREFTRMICAWHPGPELSRVAAAHAASTTPQKRPPERAASQTAS
jgi:GAF domain-containing protein